jgi:hypothetical protein
MSRSVLAFTRRASDAPAATEPPANLSPSIRVARLLPRLSDDKQWHVLAIVEMLAGISADARAERLTERAAGAGDAAPRTDEKTA